MLVEYKRRFLTALVLVTGVLACLWWGPASAWPLFLLILLFPAAWEWGGLLGWRVAARRGYVVLVTIAYALAVLLHGSPWLVAWLALACWGGAVYWMLRWQVSGVAARPAPLALALTGVCGLGGAAICLAALAREPYGPHWVLCLLTLVWLGDSVALFAGRRFGRRRLAHRISPGKTWEGAVAAGVAVLALAGWQAITWLRLEDGQIVLYLLLAVLCYLFSVLGDLVESMLKRLAGCKDSGRLFPGHGGVLDRIDGLLMATPVFYLGGRLLPTGVGA